MAISFPGATGFGKFATGARQNGSRGVAPAVTPSLRFITNLNDSGAGSARAAFTGADNCYIIPQVAGRVKLLSQLTIDLTNATYLGQLGPGPLIFTDRQVRFENCNNVIARGYLHATGDYVPFPNGEDSINGLGNTNMIFDHCVAMWGIDENCSLRQWTESTIQWSLISEALYDSVHDEGAPHSMGGILWGSNVSVHHNLYAFNNSRNPQLATGIDDLFLDFRNNLVLGYAAPATGSANNWNFISNYYDSLEWGSNFNPAIPSSVNEVFIRLTGEHPSGKRIHMSGNVHARNPLITANNYLGYFTTVGGSTVPSTSVHQQLTPYAIPDGLYNFNQTAYESKDQILKYAGWRLGGHFHEDRVFAQLRREIPYMSQWGVIDSQNDVGGLEIVPTKTVDYDVDGISLSWKQKYGLTTGVNVANAYDLHPDYPNIEVYANSIVSGKWDINSPLFKIQR